MSGAGARLDGLEASLAAIGAIAGRLDDATPMWAAIGAYNVTATQRRFEAGVAPDGNPWPPSLRVLAHGGKTLVLSAMLMGSQTFNASGSGVEWGTNTVYAAIHQLGGTIDVAARDAQVHFKTDKRSGKTLPGFRKATKANMHKDVRIPAHQVHIPARPFLGLDDNDDIEIVKIAEDFIGGAEARPQ